MTALDFIAQEEGYRDTPYRDGAGYWTIGWGRLLTMDRDADPSQWEPINRADEMRDYFAPWVERRRQRGGRHVPPGGHLRRRQGSRVDELRVQPRAFTRWQPRSYAKSSTRARVTACGRSGLRWSGWTGVIGTVGGVKSASAGLVDRRRREVALFFGVA